MNNLKIRKRKKGIIMLVCIVAMMVCVIGCGAEKENVEQKNNEAKSISLSQHYIQFSIGNVVDPAKDKSEEKLTYTLTPSTASNEGFVWESTNPEIASVSGDGVVQAHKEGQATITIKNQNGLSAKCEVSVEESAYNKLNAKEKEFIDQCATAFHWQFGIIVAYHNDATIDPKELEKVAEKYEIRGIANIGKSKWVVGVYKVDDNETEVMSLDAISRKVYFKDYDAEFWTDDGAAYYEYDDSYHLDLINEVIRDLIVNKIYSSEEFDEQSWE